jgi:cytochrome c oxidase subunit 3
MPSIFSPHPAETERKEPGFGGKPPVDRRPTGGGGGGGDGDDDRKNPRHGPRELLYRIRAFVFCALAGDMVFFLVLVALFYARQTGTEMSPGTLRQIGDWHPVLLPPILFLNTAVLLLSTLTMELARRHIFREIDVLEEWLGLGRPALRHTLPWIAATMVLGALFLIGQVVAWKELTAQGFAFDRWATPASYFFYVITGLHAAHLVVGILALLLCLSTLSRLKRVDYRQIAVDATAWFWHTMGLVWLVLFMVLVFGQ